jgi:hypothetical protein
MDNYWSVKPLVALEVQIPKHLTTEEHKLYEGLRNLGRKSGQLVEKAGRYCQANA